MRHKAGIALHFALALLLAIGSRTALYAKQTDARETEIRALVEKKIDLNGPGVAILVSRHGVPLHTAGYGLADIKTGTPITPDSLFDLASVSKHIVSHSGSWSGTASYFLLDLEKDFTVAVLSNDENTDTSSLAEEILALFMTSDE